MGYIEDKISWASARSPMCPREFHEMGALAELGTAVGARIHIDFASGPVYLNPRCLAVASSTVAKKSTGYMNPTKEILSEVAKGLNDAPFTRLPDTSTPEGFFYMLEKLCQNTNGRVTVYWPLDEYSRYFASLEKGYMNEHVEALISALDGAPETRGLAKAVHFRGEVHLVILSATVLESYEKCIQPWHFTSGLMPRHLIRIGKTSKYYPRQLSTLATTNAVFVQRLKNLVTSYYQPTAQETVMRWAPDAQKLWDRWCTRNHKVAEHEDSAIQAIHARAEETFLWLAMGYALSDKMTYLDPTYDMDAELFRKTATRIRPYIADAIRLYGCCGTKAEREVVKILSRAGGKLERWKLTKAFHSAGAGGKKELDSALDTLIESIEVIVHGKETDPPGRPGQVIELVGRR